MRRILTLTVLFLLAAAASATTAQAAAFAPGNVVIYRVGNGTDALVNSGSPVFLDEYTPTGTLVQTIALPTTDPAGDDRQLVASGTATSEGLLTRSADGRYLLATGYGRDIGGTGSVVTSTVDRVIARVDGSGAVDTTTALSDFATGPPGNNPRAAASPDGTALYGTGGTGGVRFKSGLGAGTSTQLNSAAPTNLRQVAVFDGQLFVSTGSGSAVRIGTVGTGLPTTEGQTITNLPGIPTTGSPYGFVLLDLSPTVAGVDTLYVADDSAGGSIQKYTLVGGSWTATGAIVAASVRGLTARVQGTNVTLFGTTGGSAGGGTLYGATDTSGYNGSLTGSVATLATAGANTAFRGVAFAPATPPAAGSVVVNELRGSGTTTTDDYVNLFNRSSSPIDVSGWTLRTDDNGGPSTAVQIPSVPVIPARGRLLVTNETGYSLSSLAAFDRFFPVGADLQAGGAVQLLAGGGATQDAARFEGLGTGEGNPLGTFASTDQYAFVRIANRTGTAASYGLPKDTGDNASDFRLVTAGAVGSGGSVLPAFEGVPGPVNSLGPPLANGAVRVGLIDTGAAATAAPNRAVTATPGPNGTLYVRRRITNISGGPLTSLRFRVSDLTAVRSAPVAGRSQLRLVSSDNTSVTGPSGVAAITPVTLETTPATPLPNGGGLNAVVTVPSVSGGTPLADGASINVEFALRIVQTGAFTAIFNTEAK